VDCFGMRLLVSKEFGSHSSVDSVEFHPPHSASCKSRTPRAHTADAQSCLLGRRMASSKVLDLRQAWWADCRQMQERKCELWLCWLLHCTPFRGSQFWGRWMPHYSHQASCWYRPTHRSKVHTPPNMLSSLCVSSRQKDACFLWTHWFGK